jgi:hypothetical protein
MKKIVNIFILISIIISQSCSKFESINKDPNNPTVVPAHLLLNNIVYTAFASDGDVANSTGLYSTFLGADMGACWAQHIGKIQYNDEERYIPRVTVTQDFWETMYEDVCNDANKMYSLAVEEENATLQGIALTLKAFGFHILTDCYGDIPFSEALKGGEGIFNPKYDAQEDVYKGILELLTQADLLLAQNSGDVPSTSDVVYGGDAEKWRKFANSLKFRCLMRISSKDAATDIDIAGQLQAIVSAGNIFSSVDDDAKFAFAEAQPAANPYYETIVFGSRTEFRMGEPLINELIAKGDPRLYKYAMPIKDTDSTFVGKPAGLINLPNTTWNADKTSAINPDLLLQPNSPAILMSYSELQFLIAEAVLKGYVTGDADTYYRNGIKASFLNSGLSETDFNNFANIASVSLSNVAIQNWIALFGQGVEAWIEWKRTKFPILLPAQNATISEVPSRYQYPINEQTINKTNYNAAVANQGADLLTTKIWWMKP